MQTAKENEERHICFGQWSMETAIMLNIYVLQVQTIRQCRVFSTPFYYECPLSLIMQSQDMTDIV